MLRNLKANTTNFMLMWSKKNATTMASAPSKHYCLGT